MTESTVSRMLLGQALPDPRFFEPLAKAVGVSVYELLHTAGIISRPFPPPLSETESSQVGSRSTTSSPSDMADQLGLTDPIARQMFFGTIERLKRVQQEEGSAAESADDEHGGTAARM
ncbi:hypothetical protein J7I98_04210 [Streptomyces sp. ISL-98]|nr:hypothetical protein [Streptomyces sp. ISL-98]